MQVPLEPIIKGGGGEVHTELEMAVLPRRFQYNIGLLNIRTCHIIIP